MNLIRPSAPVPALRAIACCLLLYLGATPVRAQEIRLEADQQALTRLLRRLVGARWVLVKWRSAPRLELVQPQVTITPLGFYLSGILVSRSPAVRVPVEIRFRPRVRGHQVGLAPGAVRLTQPDGLWGYLPRRLLRAYLASSAGRRALSRLALDLRPLVKALGKGSVARVRLEPGFGWVALVITLL